MRHAAPLLATLLVTLTACADGTTTSPGPVDAEAASAAKAPGGAATYDVTITNLTTGQPFTPPILVSHRPAIGLFEVGEPASLGILEIAENGNLAPLLAALDDAKHVADVVVAVGAPIPPLLPGQSITAELATERGAKFFSFAAMLICTNDGFTGVNTLKLPERIGRSVVAYGAGYDAGTEINTEDFADIVPPCPPLTGVPSTDAGTGASDPALAENGVIRHHPGIQGVADLLVDVHGWDDPVVRVEITRTN
jgi:hypothetical protein